jgi:hypothetical protein
VFGSNGVTGDSGAEEDRDASFGAKLRAGKDDEDEGKSDDEQPKAMLKEEDRKWLVTHTSQKLTLQFYSYDRRGRGRYSSSSTREVVFSG